jgi:hypothetical protein
MYEKILQKLKSQRDAAGKNGTPSNVSDRSLEDLAHTLETLIVDDATLEKADFSKAITSIDGNIIYHTSEAIKKVAEKKKEPEKKKETSTETSATKDDNGDDVPAWAKKIMKQNEELTTEVLNLKSGKIQDTRLTKLKKQLEGLPSFYSEPIVSSFKRLQFEQDDDFEAYLGEIKTNGDTFVQTAKENGLNNFQLPGEIKKPKEDGQTSELAEARELARKAKAGNEQKK